MQARLQTLEQCAIPEATRDINNIRLQLTKVLSRYDDIDRITKLMDEQQSRIEKEIEEKLNKRVTFHPEQVGKSLPSVPNTSRITYRNRKTNRRKMERKRYKLKKREAKKAWMKDHVDQNIKRKLVINISSEEVPDIAYMHLAKGLNFVESQPTNLEDITFDTKEFLRKMEWKAFFHQLADANIDIPEEPDPHSDLRIRSRKTPYRLPSSTV